MRLNSDWNQTIVTALPQVIDFSPIHQVCLEGADGEFSLPLWPISLALEPAKMVLENVRGKLKLTATQVYSLKTYGKPQQGKARTHLIVTLFIAPVATGGESDMREYYME